MKLKIFLLSQDENINYEIYDSMVVCAENEKTARNIHPCQKRADHDNDEDLWKNPRNPWATSPKNVSVRYLGIADKKLRNNEIICTSFNAG